MKNIEEIVNEIQLNEDLTYDTIIQKLNEAKENNVPIDEGILGAIGGAVLGAAIGPKLGAAICKALGVDQKGAFGSLLTSKLVMGAIGTTMGWRI
jgi:outer membrane lipoprotein SlyB